MFFPEKMTPISILFHKDHLSEVNRVLADSGVLHITESKVEEFSNYDVHSQVDRIKQLDGLVQNLAAFAGLELHYHSNSLNLKKLDIDQELREIEQTLNKVKAELDANQMEQRELYEQLLDVLYSISYLHNFEGIDISISKLSALSKRSAVMGRIPAENLPDFKKALEKYNCRLFVFDTHSVFGMRYINFYAATEFEQNAEIAALSKKYGVLENRSVFKYSGSIEDATAALIKEEWAIRESLVDNGIEKQGIISEISPGMSVFYSKLRVMLKISGALEQYKQSNDILLVSGFVPARATTQFEEALRAVFGKEGLIWENQDSILPPDEQAPTKYTNPWWMKPFELFTNTYGAPDYNEIDPTPFFFITFFIMFGMMFGDVGHGAILFISGLILLSFRSKSITPYGGVLVWAGLASMIFGWMFGSFFGYDDVIKPLIFRPFNRINTFLVIGIIIGVAIITLGIILNFINRTRKKDYFELFFGQWGVLSGLFYWMTLAVAVAAILKFNVNWNLYLLVSVVIFIPIVFKDKVYALIAKPKEKTESALAENAFSVIDILMTYFSNSVSFIRVAAFGLNHTALMLAIFQIAALLPKSSTVPDLIGGNLFVLLLEGMVVGIQIMRLEYYEFFTKFYNGTGYFYKPFKI